MSDNQFILSAHFAATSPPDRFLDAPSIVADAYEYDEDRETGHVVVLFEPQPGNWRLVLSPHRDFDHGSLEEVNLVPTAADVPKAELVFNVKALRPDATAPVRS